MFHLFLFLLLLALFPRVLLRALGCAIWAVIGLALLCVLFDSHLTKQRPPPTQARSLVVRHD
jgi:hypothetical protein